MYDFHSKYHMYQSLQWAMGDRWAMFHHPALPISNLTPICDLDQCLAQTNRNLDRLGRDVCMWPTGDQDQVARLMWVNWIHQRLDLEPIRKPILAHAQGTKLVVDCGDTRLMALSLCTNPPAVGVIATDRVSNVDAYHGWTRIWSEQDLLRAAGFAPDSHVDFRSGGDRCAIEWLEIGDQSTAHHMHDVEQRIRMIRCYINSQSRHFRFDREWARSIIDWTVYDQD
jgi:hypothetical protein